MKHFGFRRINSILGALMLTVQAICLCCACAACTSARASSSPAAEVAAAQRIAGGTPADNYSRWLCRRYSADVVTRARWLRDMMTTLGLLSENAARDDAALFVAAYGEGLTDSPDADCYAALTRADVAANLYAVLGYDPRSAGELSDVATDDEAMQTLVYYGYFVPDGADRVFPDAAVTEGEYEALMTQVRRYAALRGKHILSFGDSIMYGTGNGGEGIADMLAEKYGMTAADYAVAGAHFGTYPKTGHIVSQINEAIEVGEMADLILINGGTNDMLHTALGEVVDGYDLTLFEEQSFSGGMQTALALMRAYRGDTPVLYIRAHNMKVCSDEAERRYGERAVEIAEKWSVPTVDIYTDTDFNTEIRRVSDRYTKYKESLGRSDSAHPTALGYAKYYLPLVGDRVAELLERGDRQP